MSLLRRGITGFAPHASVDVARFKQAVYAAARASGAAVLHFAAGDGVTPSFHQADVQLGDRALSILCHRTFPLIAFVAGPVEMSGVIPMDVPELTETFIMCGFEVPDAAEWNRPLQPTDLKSLAEDEQKQVSYWKPRRISQIVFNWWD